MYCMQCEHVSFKALCFIKLVSPLIYWQPLLSPPLVLPLHADLFNKAQDWVLDKMEKEIQPKFLRSSDGQKYLEAIVSRDIKRREKRR